MKFGGLWSMVAECYGSPGGPELKTGTEIKADKKLVASSGAVSKWAVNSSN
jgi:hypothetical protein